MNWKRLRKPVAIIAAFALVVGLFPAYAVADSAGGDAGGAGDGGGIAVANVTNDKGDVNGNDAEPASGEKVPAGKEQTPTTGEKAAVEGQTPTAEEKAPAPKSGADNAPVLKAGDANAAKGDVPTAEPTRGAETHSVFVNNQDSRGSCMVSPGTEVAEGQDLVVTVSPKEGWKVKSIRFQRQASPYTELEYTTSGNTYTVTMPDCDVWLGIEYEPATDAQKYRISFEGDYNQVSFSVDYYEYERPEGDLVTVTSEGLNGYILTSVSVKETESGATVPLGGEYGTTFAMPAADVTITLEAEYKGDCGFAIGYVGDGSGMAALHDGFGNYRYASGTMNVTATAGYTVELSAEPADGYRFVGWYEGVFQEDSSQPLYGFIYDYDENTCYSTNANYSYTLSASNATAVCAVFEESSSHTVTFDTDGHYSPAPQDQEVADGEKATRPAHPAADERASDYSTTGLSFRGWYTKPANEISSYWEFCYTKSTNDAGCIFDFNEPIMQDTTAYAVYEGVLTIKAYDVTNGVEQVGGTFDHSNYNYSRPGSGSSVQTFAFYNMPEFLVAKPNEGYRFAGWSTSPSKDDIISPDAEFEYTFTQRATLYALFEVKAQDPTLAVTLSSMTIGPSGTPSAPVADVLESLTVNGEEWELSEAINPFDPSGTVYLIGSKPVPAGAQVTAVVKPTLTGMVISADHPDEVSDFETSMSADYTMTITFTMPDSDIGLGAALTLAAPVTFDANNGTPGGDWPEGNVTKIYILIAAQGKKLTVPETPDSDGVMGEGAVEPPAGSVFAGVEITDDNGTKTYKPGDETDPLVFTKGLTIKYLWAKDVTVTFDAKGGTPVPDAQTFTAGGKATEPEAPAKGDWSFAEWYTDESYESSCLFGFDNPVAEDTTLYARWNGRLTVAAFDKTNDEPGGGSFDCETISGTVESADLYTVGTVAEGTPFALTAKPAEGYRFVGWAKGSADGEVVSDKERYEPAAGFDEANLEFYAVFERIPVTVTFDTEGGIPEVGQQDLYYGDKATQPASDATGKSGWNFAGWYTEDGQLFDFNTAITEDTTLHAKWRGTIGFFSINDSEERPGGGGIITIDAEEITSVKYVTVNENDALTATAIPENGYVFVGWAILGNNEFPFHNWTIDSTNATETFTAASQPMTVCAVFKEKPPVLTLHASSVEGDDFIDPIEIEVVKGATIAQALEQYAAGTSLASKLFQKEGYQDKGYRTPKPMGDYVSYSELWGATVSGDTVLEGDFDLYYSMVKEIDAIELDIEAPVCGTSTDVPEGAYWWEDQTNPPKVSTSGENYTLDNEDGFLPAVWIISADNDDPYKGDFVGGEEYFAEVWLIPNYGYTFAEDANVTVDGGECVEPLYDGDWFGAYVKVVAAHDPAEAVEENVAAPTCVKDGSHDEVMYCNACGAEVSRETIVDEKLGHDWGEWTQAKAPTCTEPGEEARECSRCDETEIREAAALGHEWGEWTQTKAPTCTEPGEEARECSRCDETETRESAALGHDWGEWTVVKEATEEVEGLEQRTCKHCDATEEKAIPKIDVEYRCVAGDGGSLTFGSGETLSFIFKRNVNDETTFSHFVGILIDGKVVDKSNYTAKPGSVIVTLEPSFAKTLSVGDHTIEAMFNDGDNAVAAFTVTAASEEETTPAEEKPADKAASDKGKESPKTGDTLPMGAVGLTAIAAAAVLAFAWRKRRA